MKDRLGYFAGALLTWGVVHALKLLITAWNG